MTDQLKTINTTEKIKTTKQDFPQIYAYTLPNLSEKQGWVKIGYTERQSVETRIKEQTHTAAFNLVHKTLWAEPAKYAKSNIYFKDHAFHHYLTSQKERKREREKKAQNGSITTVHQSRLIKISKILLLILTSKPKKRFLTRFVMNSNKRLKKR